MNDFAVLNNVLLGVGLAMDAFSVSIANGLNEPHMSKKRMCLMAGCYGWFQWMMPMIGWFCVHTVAEYFRVFQKFIPWIALILLMWIGGKMLIEGIRKIRGSRKLSGTEKTSDDAVRPSGAAKQSGCAAAAMVQSAGGSDSAAAGPPADAVQKAGGSFRLSFGALIVQGIATSIDALSVGFTIAGYRPAEAVCASLIIAVVTFCICMGGLLFGKKFGEKLSDKATILGGLILIGIGIEIFVSGIMG